MSLRRSFRASNHYELAHLELLLFALITPLLLQPDDADSDADADADDDAADDADDANENNSDDDDLLFQPDSLLHLSEPLLQLLHLKNQIAPDLHIFEKLKPQCKIFSSLAVYLGSSTDH